MPATVRRRGRGPGVERARAARHPAHPPSPTPRPGLPFAAAARFGCRRGRLAGSRRGRLERVSRRAGGPAADPAPQGATASGATKASGGVTNDVEPVGEDNDLASRADTGASMPLVLSGVLLLAGLGLFLLRWGARRTGR